MKNSQSLASPRACLVEDPRMNCNAMEGQRSSTTPNESNGPSICHRTETDRLHFALALQSDKTAHSAWGCSPVKRVPQVSMNSKTNWEQHKARIVELYASKTLKEVMTIMHQEHNLPMSKKIYKTMFNKWGIQKNIRGNDMKVLVRKQAERSLIIKASEFELHHKKLQQRKISRLQKRNALSLRVEMASFRKSNSPELPCHLPLNPTPSLPEVFEFPQRICKLVQDYMVGSFDSGTWKLDEDYNCVSTKGSEWPLLDFESEYQQCVQSLRGGQVSTALRALNMAMANIQGVLRAQDPDTILTLTRTLCRDYFPPKYAGIASKLKEQFGRMSSIVLGQRHPLTQMFLQLNTLDPESRENVLITLWQVQLSIFIERTGRLSIISMDTYARLLRMNAIQSQFDADTGLKILCKECEYFFGPFHYVSLCARLKMMKHHYGNKAYQEVITNAQSFVQLRVQGLDKISAIQTEALRLLAEAQYAVSDYALAEQNIRSAIEAGAKFWSWQDPEVLRWMQKLGDWLESWGRVVDAAEIHRQREQIMSFKLNTLLQQEEEQYQRCLSAESSTSEANASRTIVMYGAADRWVRK